MINFLSKKNRIFYFLISALLIILVLPLNLSWAKDSSGGDAILGEWLTQEKDSKIQIYKHGSKYYGKISWLKEPNRNGKPKMDDKNPDQSKRARPIMGMNLLRDFRFVKENKWEGGKIYNPRDGKEYSCNITLKDPKTVDVRGYIGFSFIGKTELWTR